MSDAALLAQLIDERKRLDDLLDDALAQFALYEEEMNARWRGATPEQIQALMAERAQMEEAMGIADLVIRIDELRVQIEDLKSRAA